MSVRAQGVQLVTADALPEYPIPVGVRLEAHYFLNFHFNRWLSSDFRLLAPAEVRGWAVDLFCVSQNQAPVGTLPVDETLQARLLGVDLHRWRELCALPISPLYNWTPHMCGADIRLAHPVVTEIALAALQAKLRNEARREGDRARKRRLRLAEQIVEAGGHSRMAQSPAYVGRLDEWLEQNCPGNRTNDRIRAGMEQMEIGTN